MSEVEAREKLREANYFLEHMRRLDFMGLDSGIFKDKAFSYNLDGFLIAWHSILDVLQFDFAEKFSLGITRRERASREYFRHLAKALASRNAKDFSEAAAFYQWMDQREDDLLKQHALLLEKRHIIAHRGTVKTGVKEETTETVLAVNFSTSGVSTVLTAIDAFYRRHQEGSIPPPPAAAGAAPVLKEVKLQETRAYTYFKDDPEKRSIVSICGDAYDDVAQLVADAEKGSWKAPSKANNM